MKVALSGDGGDELFAGYPTIYRFRKLQRFDSVPAVGRKLMRWAAAVLPYSAYGKNFLHAMGSPTPLERYFEQTYVNYHMRRQMLTPEWVLPSNPSTLRRMLPDNFVPNGCDTVSRLMYFEATSNLTGDILVKIDRASMAASLEVRCPLLDHQLAEYATRIPTRWKWLNGKSKRILLDALGDRLPPELLTRSKMGLRRSY